MKELFSILFRFGSKSTLILAGLAGLISGACSTALLALINRLMNTDLPEGFESWMLWSFIALCILVPLFRVSSSYLFYEMGVRAARDLRIELSGRVLKAPLRRLEELGPHRLMVSLSDDIAALAMTVSSIPVLAMNAALVSGCLVYMAWLSIELALAVLVLILLGVVSYQLPANIAKRREIEARETRDVIFHYLRSLTEGTKELKMHGKRQSAFLEGLAKTSETLRQLLVRARLVLVAANSWGSMLAFLVIALVFFVAPRFLEIEAEVLSGFTLVLLYITGPLEIILGMIPELMHAGVAAAKIQELGVSLREDTTEVEQAPREIEGPSEWSHWQLAEVTHTYYCAAREDNFDLGPVSLTFEPGEIIFLIGGNGSGKTTLAKLLMGLYVPERGEILFQEQAVTDGNREEYRQNFSVVFSDYFLFPSLLGMEGPSLDDAARQYIERLQLESKVRVEQGNLSTTDLSGGQRKRLALLTAFLEDRPIYVFDEWAADQDPYFKKVFYHQILQELKQRGKTVIVVSHDDHYYDVADRIIKMQHGTVEYDRRPSD